VHDAEPIGRRLQRLGPSADVHDTGRRTEE
jgi:hypothetical protein